MGKVIAVLNQKGGTGKTTTAANLGIALANHGKNVMLLDADSQGNLTQLLGWQQPDDLSPTLTDILGMVINDEPVPKGMGILRHPENVDLMPGNIELAGLEVSLVNTMSRETILREYIRSVKNDYHYVIIDCAPSLGMLTINAMVAADSIIIPVQPHYLPVKGMEQLLKNIAKVKRHFNKKLSIDGILMTMVDERTRFARDITALIYTNYGESIKIYSSKIPQSIRAAEATATGGSIFRHDPNGKVAAAYENLAKEVLADGREKATQRRKADLSR